MINIDYLYNKAAAQNFFGEIFTDFLAKLKRREDLQGLYGVNLS